MSRITGIGLLLAGLTLGATQVRARAEGERGGDVLKFVGRVNFPESGRQGHGLKNVTNVFKEGPSTRVVAVCHGAGIGLVERVRTEHAEAVESPIQKGVHFVACENTMRQESIRKEDLLPGVGTVPSGAVEVIRKPQQDGHADFKP